MPRLQIQRLISILTAMVLGFWFPLRLIGYQPNHYVEIVIDLMVSLVSISNLILYFRETNTNFRNPKSWFHLTPIFDLICVFPLSLIELLLYGTSHQYFMFINLLTARHIFRIKSFLDEFDSLQPIVYRLVPLAFTMPILIHLIACGWIALGSGTAGPDPDKVFEYIKAVYWTMTTLTTVGYGDISAKTPPQMFWAMGTQILGVAVFGYVLSNVASLLSRMDAAREHHMNNLDRAETFMKLHKIPYNLRSKIRSYYHYLWTNRKGYLDQNLLEDLPNKIQSELFFVINKAIVEKVPFLAGASQELLEDLLMTLESKICIPGEKIFKVDEPGDALYFIQSGIVEIIAKDGKILAHLEDGAFFGEMALLSDRPRNATAIAKQFCDLYVLHKESFLKTVQTHPEFKNHIHEVMNQRKSA